MKQLISILVLIFIIAYSVNAKSISLKEAIDQKLITATIQKNNDNSTHYHSPFVADIKNLSTQYLEIVLDNGFVLTPDHEDFQHFIVTQQLLVKLKPHQSASQPIYAMCIKQDLAAPSKTVKYTPSHYGDENLIKLTRFVEHTKTFEPNAQFLLWDMISNPKQAATIDTFELYNVNQVRALGKLTNGKRESILFNYTEESEIQRVAIVSGSFSMEFGFPRNVHIGMFNMQNVIVRELYNNPKTPTGKTRIAYEFNSLEFPDEEYTIFLVVNGEIMMKRKVDLSTN
jgi:hypothetical protein